MERMQNKIQTQLEAQLVEVRDQSGDGRHVEISVVAAAFEGKSAVNRQRLVYKVCVVVGGRLTSRAAVAGAAAAAALAAAAVAVATLFLFPRGVSARPGCCPRKDSNPDGAEKNHRVFLSLLLLLYLHLMQCVPMLQAIWEELQDTVHAVGSRCPFFCCCFVHWGMARGCLGGLGGPAA